MSVTYITINMYIMYVYTYIDLEKLKSFRINNFSSLFQKKNVPTVMMDTIY